MLLTKAFGFEILERMKEFLKPTRVKVKVTIFLIILYFLVITIIEIFSFTPQRLGMPCLGGSDCRGIYSSGPFCIDGTTDHPSNIYQALKFMISDCGYTSSSLLAPVVRPLYVICKGLILPYLIGCTLVVMHRKQKAK